MGKGLSVQIGLNRVDPLNYGGSTEDLVNGEADALSMKELALSLGYNATSLLTEDATSRNILDSLASASGRLVPGDIFLLTYAGHGSRMLDSGGDETDRFDETLVLYDRMLLDDELFYEFSRFREGVRVVFVADSCYSGTVSSVAIATPLSRITGTFEKSRRLGQGVANGFIEKNKQLLKSIKNNIPRNVRRSMDASLLLLSACQDNQRAGDGITNGRFTTRLLQVWDNGRYSGNYFSFHKRICELFSDFPSQVPNFRQEGMRRLDFEEQKPFTI